MLDGIIRQGVGMSPPKKSPPPPTKKKMSPASFLHMCVRLVTSTQYIKKIGQIKFAVNWKRIFV